MIAAKYKTTTIGTITPLFTINDYHQLYYCLDQDKLMSSPTNPPKANSSTHESDGASDHTGPFPQSAHASDYHTDDEEEDDDDQDCSKQRTCGRLLPSSRKSSLPQSIHAMTLANDDTLDVIGRRFSLPFDKEQQRQQKRCSCSSSQRRSQRTKSLPRRSPALLPTTTHGVFTMNVFDRPRISPGREAGVTKEWHRRRSSANTDKSSTSLCSSRLSTSTSSPSSLSVSSLSLSPIPQPVLPTSHSTSLITPNPPPPPAATSTLYIDANNKPRVDTFFYDQVDLSTNDHDVYAPSWLPLWESHDSSKKATIRVVWKGSPLCINALPYYDSLHANERSIASTLRLTPEQYLKCKRAMILSAQVFYDHGLPFRKSDAQKVCRIDVNKTSSLWGVFNRLGWLLPRSS
ncbi:hypothetical protein [Absidia glauca]|uniref:SWIRM domain-containing protein n=1 Tax=Absidia glauca TaxID=4829 RepID=A0A163K303_ABSGL|nr:hypothetical protein [Absidia glauca]